MNSPGPAQATPNQHTFEPLTPGSGWWLTPAMLLASSLIMAFAWLGHLLFKEVSFPVAILCAWLLVLPEYALNVAALRRGYRFFSGGQMAAFNLASGVLCVALVSRFALGEPLTPRKVTGFVLMAAAMFLVGKDAER